jgi:hypothetical protein
MNALHVAAATGCAETTEALLLLGALVSHALVFFLIFLI